MKRKGIAAVLILVVLVIFAFLLIPFGQRYTLPFTAEEVESVMVGNPFWLYKTAESTEDISQVIQNINRMKIIRPYDEKRDDDPEEGNFGCTIFFCLKDGREYELYAMDSDGLKAFFTDETGITYKVRNLYPLALWNQLDVNPQKRQ